MAKRQENESGPASRAAEPLKSAAQELKEKRCFPIAMKRAARCGEVDLNVGDPVGEVTCQPGVDLNYLIDGCRSGLCGPVK